VTIERSDPTPHHLTSPFSFSPLPSAMSLLSQLGYTRSNGVFLPPVQFLTSWGTPFPFFLLLSLPDPEAPHQPSSPITARDADFPGTSSISLLALPPRQYPCQPTMGRKALFSPDFFPPSQCRFFPTPRALLPETCMRRCLPCTEVFFPFASPLPDLHHLLAKEFFPHPLHAFCSFPLTGFPFLRETLTKSLLTLPSPVLGYPPDDVLRHRHVCLASSSRFLLSTGRFVFPLPPKWLQTNNCPSPHSRPYVAFFDDSRALPATNVPLAFGFLCCRSRPLFSAERGASAGLSHFTF